MNDRSVPARAADSVVDAGCFDAFYFEHGCGAPYRRDPAWLAFFGKVANRIVADMRPHRVLDAGCAFGFLVETLRERGVEAEGVDLSAFAIDSVHASVRPYCRQGSIAEELGGIYDLIVTIEVLEHLPAREGERAIENICAHTTDVLFSSSPNDHREPTHVNVQPTEYWAEQFARHGFFRDVDYDASYITQWAVRFRKRHEPLHRIVREYERQYSRLLVERNEAHSYALQIQAQLARYTMPLSEKVWRVGRRIAGSLARAVGR